MEAFNKTNVLVTDLSIAYRNRLAEQLESTGLFNAKLAANEKQAFSAITTQKPEVFILDPFVASDTCAFFIKQALNLSPKLKIIVLSFEKHEDLINDCMNSGAKGFLNKTRNLDFLLDSILKICAGEKIVSRDQAA